MAALMMHHLQHYLFVIFPFFFFNNLTINKSICPKTEDYNKETI